MPLPRSSLAFLFLLLLAEEACAHNLQIVAEVLPERTVRVHSFFDDATHAVEARVTVRDANGQIVAQGRTDPQGLWHFPRPKPGTYTIKVEYIGHDRELTLPLPEDESLIRAATRDPNLLVGLAVGLVLCLGVAAFVWRRRTRRIHSPQP